jgi:hypothetical protein
MQSAFRRELIGSVDAWLKEDTENPASFGPSANLSSSTVQSLIPDRLVFER